MDSSNSLSQDFSNISSFTPVVESKGKKNVGLPSQIFIICAMNDQRNMPKRDAKGKIIKKKKGVPDAKSLYPSEHKDALDRLFLWFDTKFRPYTQHMQQLIPKAFNKGNKEQLDELDKNI
jgi:hypothetical protein